jgi:hypothetical protein
MTIAIIAALVVFFLPRSKEPYPRVLDLTLLVGKRKP